MNFILVHIISGLAAFIGMILTIVGIFKTGFLGIGLTLFIGGIVVIGFNLYRFLKNPSKALNRLF